MNCIITYQKSNGDVFIRPYNHTGFVFKDKKGSETAMGWKILDIHYKYKDNFYCYDDYLRILDREIRQKNNKKLLRLLVKKLSKIANV